MFVTNHKSLMWGSYCEQQVPFSSLSFIKHDPPSPANLVKSFIKLLVFAFIISSGKDLLLTRCKSRVENNWSVEPGTYTGFDFAACFSF